MSTAAETHDAMVEAAGAQRAKLFAGRDDGDRWGGQQTRRFRVDPHRKPEPVLQILMEYAAPDDVVLDIGGGAGRYSLPLAFCCRETVCVDPSPGMRHEFEETAAESGIGNARYMEKDWMGAEGISGDLSLAFHVTYFVGEIAPFLQKLQRSTRRRAVVGLASQAPLLPNLHRLVYGEEPARWPSYRELLPVLWDMGLFPEVRMPMMTLVPAASDPRTKESFIATMLPPPWLLPEDMEKARQVAADHFDELCEMATNGFQFRETAQFRNVLVTWEV